jgi:hypothetical protein
MHISYYDITQRMQTGQAAHYIVIPYDIPKHVPSPSNYAIDEEKNEM